MERPPGRLFWRPAFPEMELCATAGACGPPSEPGKRRYNARRNDHDQEIRRSFRDPITTLHQAGFTVKEKDYDRVQPSQEDEVCRVIQGADVIIVTAMFPSTRKIIESSGRLKMIAIRRAGFEGSNLKAATDNGVGVNKTRDPIPTPWPT